MYFDLEPKSKREDLYDLDEQFEKLIGLLRERRARAPLIVVTGLRRTGKTSLIQTALNESTLPHLTLTGMEFAGMPTITMRDIFRVLESRLNQAIEEEKGWREKFIEALGGIRWLRMNSKPPWIHFEWTKPTRVFDLSDIIHALDGLANRNKTKFVLVIDEAQEFRKLMGYRIQALLAYIFDNVKNIQMIVSGSQVGLLHNFLATDDPRAPLFGRGTTEVRVPRIPNDLAIDFLEKGFEQTSIEPKREIIELAADKLDGIIGWLTLFGSKSVERGSPSPEVLEEVFKEGSRLEAEELKNFLRTREQARKRYIRILLSAARLGRSRWTDLKEELEFREKKRITDRTFSDLLGSLVDAGFLEKTEDGAYSVPDPILLRALKSGLLR
jgi:AAA+ ATPase superfamily predicted ATPase